MKYSIVDSVKGGSGKTCFSLFLSFTRYYQAWLTELNKKLSKEDLNEEGVKKLLKASEDRCLYLKKQKDDGTDDSESINEWKDLLLALEKYLKKNENKPNNEKFAPEIPRLCTTIWILRVPR